MYYKNLNKILRKSNHDFNLPVPIKFILSSLNKTKQYFIDNFGNIDVVFEDFQMHVRGDVAYPVAGLVDMIAATSTKSYIDGKVKAVSGDSYIMLVRYGNDEVEIETVLPYGVSTHSDSPHYTDQMPLYVSHKRKKMYLNKEEILKNADRIYNPK
jgi:acyl-homoserine-lactone acylase